MKNMKLLLILLPSALPEQRRTSEVENWKRRKKEDEGILGIFERIKLFITYA